ncbi:histone-fold-containing protein [Chaetomium sp. MPI-SDFR-AT-0129]|nr:histone-fold-containing protein [Chaetomium sp. MPI-SDFR-AT-0129]
MPARKSDARKSDVSVARFVLVEGDTVMATDTPSTEPAAPAGTAESAAPGSAPPQSGDKKDKDKEKEKEKEKERDTLTIEDLTLPKSIITRLAKGMLPPNTQIQANAILALTKSATVFISHLADAANEFTTGANRKTITPHDVFNAIDEIEYGFMREKLEAEFAKFNEVQTSKRSTYRKKVAAAKKAASQPGSSGVAADISMISTASTTAAGDEAGTGPSGGGGGSQARAAKKARLDPTAGGADDSRMDVDEEVSDAETVPEEQEEEGGDEDEDEEDEEEEEEEEEDDEEGGGEDGDELEEREAREDEDEALDDDSD